MASEVSICTNALVKCGAEGIVSMTEDNRRAILCNAVYADLRDTLLISHPWNFAIKRVQLAQTTTPPLFDFTYEYLLPADCLRVLSVDSTLPWAKEVDKIVANDSTINIKYIAQVTDPNKFTAQFREGLSLYIAKELCFALTQSNPRTEALESKFEQHIRSCRSYDAQEGTPPELINDLFINSRL